MLFKERDNKGTGHRYRIVEKSRQKVEWPEEEEGDFNENPINSFPWGDREFIVTEGEKEYVEEDSHRWDGKE